MTKTFTYLLLFISTIIFSSCNNNSADNISDKQIQTPDFLKKYTQTSLPITMKGCFGNSFKLPLINSDSLQSDNEDGTVPYCTFKTNGDYYAVIRLGLSDCALPYLITYDKDGKIIDQKSIGIGLCGASPGFRCEEFSEIKSDFSIYASDTIAEAEIDSLGQEIKSTFQNYVIYIKGRLLSTGKIELTDTLRQTIKK